MSRPQIIKLGFILFFLLLTACGGGNKKPVPVDSYGGKAKQSRTTNIPTTYKVKSGDTLYSISWRYNLNYKTVAKNNKIKSPYTIFVGQKLTLKSSYKATSKKKSSNKKSTSKKASTKKTTSNKARTKKTTSNKKLTWQWPTQGKVISSYSKSVAGRKGINISGKSGQKVVAAAAGKVVYSGDGLPRYGNLLIIKHNDVYLSAYAHNKTLLLKEGQQVKAGQKIATLGRTGTKKNQLHFEVRRNGEPVDPMRFLPKP